MKFWKLVPVSIALFLSSHSNAALVEVDLFTTGDGLLIRDTVNNLEWLDVTQTVGMSASDSIAAYESYGFSLATASDVIQLYTEAGIVDISDGGTTRTPENVPGVFLLLTLMNHTEEAFRDNTWVHGFIDDFGDPLTVTLARFTDNVVGAPTLDAENGYAHVNTNGLWSVDDSDAYVGSFLVRTSVVPVPAAIWLFGSGLIGLAAVSRRKHS